MKFPQAGLALLLAVGLAACSDATTTEPELRPQLAKKQSASIVEQVTGTLTGGTFTGTAQITNFAFEDGAMMVSGVLNGVATVAGIPVQITNQAFTTTTTLTSPSAVCDILFLDLGPIFLDLLGLTVDLSQIVLDINAVPGPGNLLGNLLCAVVNLLNPGHHTTGLQHLLDLINNLLG